MKKICVSVLDWGLGHATRSFPLIKYLCATGCEVILASSGTAAVWLRRQFPELRMLELPAYNVRYHRTHFQRAKVLQQVPRLLKVIQAEHRAIAKAQAELSFDGIISDHRYGCWHRDLPSVLIAHQLAIPADLMTRPLYAWHKRWLAPFDEIWVPDYAGKDNLSGKLAHTHPLPSKLKYIGPLSQFWDRQAVGESASQQILAILSGPEPQRSLLHHQLESQLLSLGLPATLVGGKEDIQARHEQNLTIIPLADSDTLYEHLCTAQWVISRSGYSSLMDYATLGIKQTILIPTPGQPEQEYLAHYHQQHGRTLTAQQGKLDLEGLIGSTSPVGWKFSVEPSQLAKTLTEWLGQ